MFLFVVLAGTAIMLAVVTFNLSDPLLAFFIALLSMLLTITAFSTKYYTYLYVPALHMKKGKITLSATEPFTLAPSGTSIVRRDEDGIYASSFVTIPIYRSGTEMSAEERLDMARLFSRILTVTKNTIKISSQMYIVNKDEYIAKIRQKLDEAEAKFRALPTQQGMDKARERAEGEVTMWHNLLNNVSISKSEALITYAMVSAFGTGEEEATTLAYQRAEEVASGISAILGVSAYVARGDEVLDFIEPDRMVPVETVNEMIRQKSVEEGV